MFGKLDDRNGNVTCVHTGRVIRRAFEPRNEHKGNVARTLFYFAVRYDRPLRPWQEKALRGWNALDPPDADEVARTNNIELVDGTRNPLSTTPSTSIGSTTSKACHAPSALLPSIGDRHPAAGGKGQRRGGVPRATSAQGPPPARRKVRASRCPVRLDRHLPAPCVGHALAGPSRR